MSLRPSRSALAVPLALAVCVHLFSSARSAAQEPAKPEAVLVNLLNPCGVAIQPETGYVFISTRLGIYRYDPNYSDPFHHRASVEIDGYPKDAGTLGPGGKYQIGPLGLAFLDKEHLIVGDGSRKPGEEMVRVYKIAPKALGLEDWIKEDAPAYSLGPIKAGKDSAKGEGNFYGVAVGAGAAWITCQGDESKGWIAKAEIQNGKLGELKPAIATKVVAQVDAPGAIAFTPDAKELLVGEMALRDAASAGGPASLTFYDPAGGSLKRKVKTSLADISGLAYSPKTAKLYATDFSSRQPEQGGLFELAIEGESAKATKIASIEKPTALAFDKEGHLYVTTFGAPKEAVTKVKAEDAGGLLYFPPGL